jgi:transposase
MRTKRKLYAKEFKDQAISLVREANRSASSVAKELDINVNTMYNWLGSSSNTGANQSSGKEYALEIKRLKKELAQAEMERDILKKALWVQPVIATTPYSVSAGVLNFSVFLGL